MKKTLLVMAAFAMLASFALTQTAEASFIEIGSPILGPIVYSPGSNGADPTTTVGVAPTGSVTIGAPTAEGDTQPAGIYGVGVALGNLGLVPWYEIAFDINFTTYDSASYDLFEAVITQGDYLWNDGIPMGGYSWGGATEGGVEYAFDTYNTQAKVFVTPGLDYYVNAVLHTSADSLYPSWGTFSDFSVNVVPEPTSMLLLGFGLIGFAGKRFKRRFKA